MAILDTLEQAAGLTDGGSATTAPRGVVGAVLQMLQAQPGGVMGVVQQFERAGLGGVAQSWLASGSNQALGGQDVQNALGPGPVGQVAQQLGVPKEQAAGHIAQLLPLLLDHLSPNGQAPADGGLGAIGGLLSGLGRG